MEQYIAAYDIGTSSVKLALVDASGKVLRSDTEGYPPCQLDGKRAEQDPGDYWNAVCRVTRRLACNVPAGAVCGLVLAAMWKGIIPLDRQGNTLHSNILWLDSRGEKQAAYLNQKLGEEILNGWDYWAKLLWFKENHPDLYRETDCFLEVNSYLKYRMTGIKLVDHCNAFTDSLDEGLKQFFRRIVEAAGFDESKFAPLGAPWETAGALTAGAAEQLGLEPGIPVYGGCTDIAAIALGAGACREGEAHLYLGSSGWIGIVVPGELGVVTNPFAAIAPGHNLGMYSLQSAGLSLDWALERFYPEERNRLGGGIFSLLRKELAGIPPGAGGLVCAPWLHGEQQPVPPSARLAFLGARPEHSRVHFIAAVLEGIAYTLRWRLEAYRSIGEIPLRIRAVGGGAENPIWMQMMADILQAEIQVTENPRHAGTVGAASFAWIGMGVYRNLSEAAGKIAVREHYYPRREYMSRYDILYEALKTAAPALDCFSRELSRFDNLSV